MVIENCLKRLTELDEQIQFEMDGEDAENDSDESIEIAVRTSAFLEEMKIFVHGRDSCEKPSAVEKGTGTCMSKLPKITLPKFNGNVTDWVSFWERFKEEIDSHPTLSDVHKFDYLYGLLEGEALNAVKSILPSKANYKILKDTLVDNFGKHRKIVRAHI